MGEVGLSLRVEEELFSLFRRTLHSKNEEDQMLMGILLLIMRARMEGGLKPMYWAMAAWCEHRCADNVVFAAPDLLAAAQAAFEDGSDYKLSFTVKEQLREAISKATVEHGEEDL